MKILIVDDHPVVRAGLAALLQQLEADMIVLQASSAREGLGTASVQPDIDLILLDLMMPEVTGIEALTQFNRTVPQIPVMVLSSSEAPEDVRQALAAGALGYAAKSAAPQTLLAAVRFVLAGEIYVPPFMARADSERPTDTVDAKPSVTIGQLTERQMAVLELVCRGRSNKEIARDLDISDKTVKAHVTTIFRVLNVVNRTQAARAAAAAGIG
jgi:DNA-binding NarL/FixJ family response regulator